MTERMTERDVAGVLLRGKVLAEAAGFIAVRKERGEIRKRRKAIGRELSQAARDGSQDYGAVMASLDENAVHLGRLNAEVAASVKRLERAVAALNRWRSREGFPELDDEGAAFAMGVRFTTGVVFPPVPARIEGAPEDVAE